MAFNEQEQQIIKWGLQNNKSQDEVILAIAKFRSGGVFEPTSEVATEEKPSFLQRAGDVLSSSAEKATTAIRGEDEFSEMSPIRRGFEAAASISGAIPRLGYEALPEVARKGLSAAGQAIGGAISPVINKISETSLFKEIGDLEAQGYISKETAPEFYKLKESLGTAQAAGQIAGDILITDIAAKGATAGVKSTVKAVEKLPVPKLIDNIFSKTSPVTDYAKSRAVRMLGIGTGESDDVIRAVLLDPKTARIGLKGGDKAVEKAVATAVKDVTKLKASLNKGYQESFNRIVEKAPKGNIATKQKILFKFVDDVQAKGAKLKGGKWDFTTSKIKTNPGEVAKIKDAYKAIQNWSDFSFKGINELKQFVGGLKKWTEAIGKRNTSPTLGSFYNYLDDTIKSSLPKNIQKQFIQMNTKYSSVVNMYDDMARFFKNPRASEQITQVFGKNKMVLRNMLEFYEKQTGKNIKPIIAGREVGLEKMTSTGAFSWLSPRSWIDFFVSPQKQGEIIIKVGEKLPLVKP